MSKTQTQNVSTETTVTLTPAEELDLVLEGLPTTSAKIRHLTALEWKRGDIAKKLGVRYQHVRNIQITPVKRTELK